MEGEPKIEQSEEDKLCEKGYQIKRAQLSEDDSRQCNKCMDKDKDFQFHQEGWFIEGEFYCLKHKEGAISAAIPRVPLGMAPLGMALGTAPSF